jgi:hypothetical protein
MTSSREFHLVEDGLMLSARGPGQASVITPKPANEQATQDSHFLYAWISPADKSARWVL